jgi:RNA polymerase sigma factor (sigma-70 family)
MPYARRTMVNLHRSAFRRVVSERRALAATDRETVHVDPVDHAWEAILRLPRGQRAIVALRYYEGLTEQEIADTMSVTVGTVKKQTHRAMAALRAALGDRSES